MSLMKMDIIKKVLYILWSQMEQYLSRNSKSNIHEMSSVTSLDNGLAKSESKQKKKLQKVTIGNRQTKPQSTKLISNNSDVKYRTSSNFFP